MTIIPTETTNAEHRRYLMLGLLAGPVVWSIYFILGYFFVEVACTLGEMTFSIWRLPGKSYVIVALTLVAAVVTAYAGWRAYQSWRQLPPQTQKGESTYDPQERSYFMTLAAVQLNALFMLLNLATGAAALLLEIC